MEEIHQIGINLAPPGFYNDDIRKLEEKFSKAMLTQTNKFKDIDIANLDINYRSNSSDIDHLCRGRVGETSNFGQVHFATSMRVNKFTTKFNNLGNSHSNTQWKNNASFPTRPITSEYIPPLRDLSKKILETHQDVNTKQYDVIHNLINKNEEFGKGTKFGKKYIASDKLNYFLGYNQAKDYNNILKAKNLNVFRHLTKHNTNPSSKWEAGLRGDDIETVAWVARHKKDKIMKIALKHDR